MLVHPKLSATGIILGFIYTSYFIPITPDKLEGQGIFIPEKITPIRSLTYKGFLISGNVRSFQTKENTYHHIPTSIFTKFKSDSLFSPFSFFGTLEKKDLSYQMIIDDRTSISLNNLSLFRYHWKTGLQSFLKKKIKDRSSSNFLSALITGYLTDLYLKFSFFKLGLSHILAISGFHFSLLIALISFFLSPIPIRPKSIVLIFAASTYFLLMGHSPSITRAYIMIVFYYLAKLFDKESCPINNLGSALFVIILIDPYVYSSLSFQLSFLSCLGIFLYYPLLASFIKTQKGILQRLHAYYLHSIALCFAVNLMIFPLLLYIFHKISILGMFYNLFFPFQVTICFSLLLIALFIYPVIPFLSDLIFWALNPLTTLSLIPVLNPPLILDYSVRSSLQKEVVILWLVGSLVIGIYLKSCLERRNIKQKIEYL